MTDPADYLRVANGMWAAPELTGDLLAVGVYCAQRLYLGGPWPETLSTRDTARAVFGPGRQGAFQFGRVMRGDIRRYDPWVTARARGLDALECEAPMIRRAGLCGKPATRSESMAWDLDTGERHYIARCGRHIDWARHELGANKFVWEAIREALRPVPPANVGGVLRRHLPELDWPAYWSTLDERWSEPPERVPFVRPTLRVIITDDVEPDPAMPRAALSLVTP